MRTRFIAGVLVLTVADGSAQEVVQNELAQAKESLAEVIADTTVNADVFDTNGFHAVASNNAQLGADFRPDGYRFQHLEVTAPDVFGVGIEKGRPSSTGGGVSVFHRETHQPMLSAADRDGDGVLDLLTYSVLDASGENVLEVIDYEADGQADMRLNFKEHYFEIWHLDRWYRAETRDGRRGIVVAGEFVELERGDNRWIVP